MAVSLRLTAAEEKALAIAARRAGISKSQYLRQCLTARLVAEQSHSWAYELGKDLFGKYASGRSDLSVNAEKIVREKIHAKARRHRHRTGRGSIQSG